MCFKKANFPVTYSPNREVLFSKKKSFSAKIVILQSVERKNNVFLAFLRRIFSKFLTSFLMNIWTVLRLNHHKNSKKWPKSCFIPKWPILGTKNDLNMVQKSFFFPVTYSPNREVLFSKKISFSAKIVILQSAEQKNHVFCFFGGEFCQNFRHHF